MYELSDKEIDVVSGAGSSQDMAKEFGKAVGRFIEAAVDVIYAIGSSEVGDGSIALH